MSFSVKKLSLILIALVSITIFSYQGFTKYKPKKIMPLEETHGVKTQFTISVPYPNDYIILGSSSSENIKSITFKTSQTPEQVQSFYKTILLEEGWEIDKEDESGTFIDIEYKRGKDKIKVTTSAQDNSSATIVGVDIIENN